MLLQALCGGLTARADIMPRMHASLCLRSPVYDSSGIMAVQRLTAAMMCVRRRAVQAHQYRNRSGVRPQGAVYG